MDPLLLYDFNAHYVSETRTYINRHKSMFMYRLKNERLIFEFDRVQERLNQSYNNVVNEVTFDEIRYDLSRLYIHQNIVNSIFRQYQIESIDDLWDSPIVHQMLKTAFLEEQMSERGINTRVLQQLVRLEALIIDIHPAQLQALIDTLKSFAEQMARTLDLESLHTGDNDSEYISLDDF
jgi:hypothetical protein